MSLWYDEDGELLGQWLPCTADEYVEILNTLADPVVMAGHTEVGDRTTPYTEEAAYRDRHVHSEWGERGADAPVVRCHDDWDYFGEQRHTHARFERYPARVSS